jgi:hypothetical protein
MAPYRIYPIDSAGHIVSAAIEFEAGSDEQAASSSFAHFAGEPLELWSGSRLVRKFEGKPTRPLSESQKPKA